MSGHNDEKLGSTIADRLRLFGIAERRSVEYAEAAVEVIAETMLFSKSEELRFKAAKAMVDIGKAVTDRHRSLVPSRTTPGGVYIDAEIEAAEADVDIAMRAEQYVGKVPWEDWPADVKRYMGDAAQIAYSEVVPDVAAEAATQDTVKA